MNLATLTDLGCISINSSWISLPATALTELGGVSLRAFPLTSTAIMNTV